jgi:AAA+ superfamily predicted ATPase
MLHAAKPRPVDSGECAIVSEPLDQTLWTLLDAGPRCVRIRTSEEDEAFYAAHAAAMSLGSRLLTWSVVRGVTDALLQDARPVPQTENAGAGLFHFATRTEATVFVTLDLTPHLKDDRTLRSWRELVAGLGRTGSRLVMIDSEGDVPAIVQAHSTLIEPSLPDEAALLSIVRNTARELNREFPVETQMPQSHLDAIVKNLLGLTRRHAREVIRDCIVRDRKLDISDLPTIVLAKRRLVESAGVLEFVDAPANMDQIGGLTNLKSWLTRRAAGFRSDAAQIGLTPPRGVLLLGVQGSGKSLCAKAVATAWNRPLLRLDAGALYDRYVGESERRLREALRQAEMMAPVVLWIDEIEKAFASAASTSSDGGLSRRMFGTLLTWMQEHQEQVFLAATANDIEALPAELLRKGRFDEIFFVDLPTLEARAQIFGIHLRKRNRAPGDVDVGRLAAATEGFTGAEIEQAIVSALSDCFGEGRPLSTEAIERSCRSSPPLSVTMREQVASLREWAKGRCVPAD